MYQYHRYEHRVEESKKQQMHLVFCLSKIAMLPHIKQICIDFKANDFYTKCFRDSPYFSKINYCLNSDSCELLSYCMHLGESHKLAECLFLYQQNRNKQNLVSGEDQMKYTFKLFSFVCVWGWLYLSVCACYCSFTYIPQTGILILFNKCL